MVTMLETFFRLISLKFMDKKSGHPSGWSLIYKGVLALFFATITVAAHKLINTTSCVHELLLTSEERVR